MKLQKCYMRQGLRIISLTTFFLFSFMINYSFSCQKNLTDTVKQYSILVRTDSGYDIVTHDVKQNEVNGRFYMVMTLVGNRVIRIEFHDEKGYLCHGLYFPAIIIYTYDELNRIGGFSYFDENNKPIIDEFNGVHLAKIKYDERGRIIEQDFFDSKGVMLTPLPGTDLKAPIVRFSYENKRVLITELNKEGKLISKYYGKVPCIPFINCKR
jgi:hypothetical protein